MTLGMGIFVAVFSSTILVLAVYHRQFRKVLFLFAGTSTIAAGVFFLSVRLYRQHEAQVHAEAEQKIQACVARFPIPYVLDGQRMSVSAIASACAKNTDFSPVLSSNYLANIVEIRGGGTLQITPAQKFSPDGEPDAIPIIYLGHRQTFLLSCGYYGEPQTGMSINQGLVSCPAASVSTTQECPQWDDKADKWAKYIGLTLGDCTNNGCVVYRGKKIMGGISHNEITNAQWHTCQAPESNPGVKQVSSSK